MNAFDEWLGALEARHLAELTFPEMSRALRALSSAYVERRGTIAEGAALAGRGKRAAFALFYGPLHYLLIDHIVRSLPGAIASVPALVDLGCGTGASGAAWASAISPSAPVTIAVDVNAWALGEAALTYRAFGVRASTKQANIATFRLPPSPGAVLAAFALNELTDDARDDLLSRLIARARGGDRVLVVEPIAGFVTPWWRRWASAFVSAGGRSDEWRVRVELPPIVAKLDRAAKMNHRELTGRSLWIASPSTGRAASS